MRYFYAVTASFWADLEHWPMVRPTLASFLKHVSSRTAKEQIVHKADVKKSEKSKAQPRLPPELGLTRTNLASSFKKSGPESTQKEAAATAFLITYEPTLWELVPWAWAGLSIHTTES